MLKPEPAADESISLRKKRKNAPTRDTHTHTHTLKSYCPYLQIHEKRRLPTVVLDAACLELYIARLGALHVKIEHNNIVLKMVSDFDDVIE